MSPFRFMGEQEDPEMDAIEARGGTRVYDGTGKTPKPHVDSCDCRRCIAARKVTLPLERK